MAGEGGERRKKARHDDVDPQYKVFARRKQTVTRTKQLPRATLQIEEEVDEEVEVTSSDDDEEEEYVPSPPRQTSFHSKGKSVADYGGISGAAGDDDEINEEEEEIFDVDEPIPAGAADYGAPKFQIPSNPHWRAKVSYKGKSEAVREMRAVDPRPLQKEASDYRFQTYFQQDFYESVILAKTTPVAISQWINWRYLEDKGDPILNEVIAACRAKNVSAIMGLEKNWNNEIIAQFFSTLYVEEHDGINKFHWMTEGRWFEVSYAQFARILGFGRNDANRPRLHLGYPLKAAKMGYMYPRNKQVRLGHTTDLLPFYGYLNRLFRKTLTPREGDATAIPSYNKNILAAMTPSPPHGTPFSVFDFIWEEIKIIANNPLKSCGYAPYIMLMIEKVTGGSFECEMKHTFLRVKANLKMPVEESGAAAQTHGASTSRGPSSSKRHKGSKSSSPIKKFFNFFFGMCRSQYDADVRAHHERQERKKITKRQKQIMQRSHPEIECSPIGSENEESPPMETFEERMSNYQQQNLSAQYFGDESFSDYGFGFFGEYQQQQQPPPFDSPPRHEEEEERDDGDDEDDE